MYTLEGLDKEHVKKIYQNTVLYSIYKYDELDIKFQPIYNKKFQNAVKLKNDLEIFENPSKEEIKSFLDEQKVQVEMIQNQNQEVIDVIAKASVETLKNEMPADLTKPEKCQYIFDFVTKTMKFDEDWYNYCANVPPIDGYDFMFDKGVPASKSYDGLLVTRVGNSDDITSLMIFLGNELGVKLEKTYCKLNSKRRAINYINNNGFVSYMDPIAVIRNEKEKENVFLVSENKLGYPVKDNMISTNQTVQNPKYNMQEIINKVNQLLPEVNYVSYDKLEK